MGVCANQIKAAFDLKPLFSLVNINIKHGRSVLGSDTDARMPEQIILARHQNGGRASIKATKATKLLTFFLVVDSVFSSSIDPD